jgi:O-antigen ligase
VQIVANLEMRSQDAETDITRIGAGWLMGMAILLLLFYPLSRRRGRRRMLLIFLVPLFLAGLMASAARGPMVALSIAVLIGVAVWMKEGRMKIVTAAALLFFLTIGVGGAYLVLRQTDRGKYTAKASELETMFAGGTTTGSAGKRVDFYRATLNAIPNQPLLGTGIGSWSKFYYGSDQRNYPHDLLLEIAFEEGLIGLAAFLAVLGLAAISIVRMIGDSRSHFLVLGLLVLYCVIVSLFSGDLDDNRVLWLWMGVALSVCRLVQVRMSAIRSMEYSARRASAEAFRPVGAPAFSHQPAAERNP